MRYFFIVVDDVILQGLKMVSFGHFRPFLLVVVLLYPFAEVFVEQEVRLSLEQCTSQYIAQYKAGQVENLLGKGLRMADIRIHAGEIG